jgi:hypothetical protein
MHLAPVFRDFFWVKLPFSQGFCENEVTKMQEEGGMRKKLSTAIMPCL